MNNIEKSPLISVIVPVYKTEEYLERCINSILNQTYKDIELILVDDGSPDKCPEICDMFTKKDERVKVIHKVNGGVSTARNAGIEVATGEYIAFVDSDDYIELHMYEKMIDEIRKNQADICVCQWQYTYSNGKNVINLEPIDKSIYGVKKSDAFAEYLYRGQYENCTVGVICNKLYRRCIFDNVRFSGKSIEDERIHNIILSRNYLVVIIPDQLYFYCQNNDSITNRPFDEDCLMFLDVLYERIEYFSNNKFITTNSKKLYCNMYIEYYYKERELDMNMRDISHFDEVVKELILSREINLKFAIRMLLFRFCPQLYRKVCNV